MDEALVWAVRVIDDARGTSGWVRLVHEGKGYWAGGTDCGPPLRMTRAEADAIATLPGWSVMWHPDCPEPAACDDERVWALSDGDDDGAFVEDGDLSGEPGRWRVQLAHLEFCIPKASNACKP
jgi:hypothetical protein